MFVFSNSNSFDAILNLGGRNTEPWFFTAVSGGIRGDLSRGGWRRAA